jgi:hypothetical protein
MEEKDLKKRKLIRNSIITVLIIGRLFVIWWIAGEMYRFGPTREEDRLYYVSFHELEDELKNEPIIVPDISFELPERTETYIDFERGRFGRKTRRYGYYMYTNIPKGTVEFEEITISAEPYSPNRKTVCNTTRFGIEMEEFFGESSEDKEYLSSRELPYGTFVYRCYYQFDYKEHTYLVHKRLALSPDSLEETDKESEKERIVSEVQSVVKSIVDKGREME